MTKDLVIDNCFTALEVDPFNGAQCLGLTEDVLDGFDGHGATLRRPALHKTMAALVVALIGQQKVQSGQWT